MDIKHITSDSLRSLLSLTDKKEQLIKAIADVENQIVRTLKGAATTTKEVAKAVTPFKKARKAKKSGKAKASKSGGLKERILGVLQAAGDEGLRVKDIAAKLASNPANISVWFSTTGKKITTKLAPGLYAAKGDAKSAPARKAAKPAKKVIKAKKKSGLSAAGRARIADAAKARWAAHRAAKGSKPAAKPAKKKVS
ncbi:MAG: hypothetical protein WCG76_06130 [Verrucomicrobiota bacterium]|jgi:hypothetical protein